MNTNTNTSGYASGVRAELVDEVPSPAPSTGRKPNYSEEVLALANALDGRPRGQWGRIKLPISPDADSRTDSTVRSRAVRQFKRRGEAEGWGEAEVATRKLPDGVYLYAKIV